VNDDKKKKLKMKYFKEWEWLSHVSSCSVDWSQFNYLRYVRSHKERLFMELLDLKPQLIGPIVVSHRSIYGKHTQKFLGK
jgi:hypothetical protein